MRTTQEIPESNYQPRPQQRKTGYKHEKHFQWKKLYPGKAALILLWLWALDAVRGSDAQLQNDRRWARRGITAKAALRFVCERITDFESYFEEQTGRKPPPGLALNRLDLMFWQRNKGAVTSREHPTVHLELTPYLSKVSKLFEAGYTGSADEWEAQLRA